MTTTSANGECATTIECKHNYTYTIWAGVDFVILLPDGRVLDKRLFLLELLKAHAA